MCSTLKIFILKCHCIPLLPKWKRSISNEHISHFQRGGCCIPAPCGTGQKRSVAFFFSFHSFLVHFEVSWLKCHSFASSWERLSCTSEEVLTQKLCVPLQGRPSTQLGILGCRANPGEPALCPVLLKGTCQMSLERDGGIQTKQLYRGDSPKLCCLTPVSSSDLFTIFEEGQEWGEAPI